MNGAIQGGHRDVVRWLREKGVEWTEYDEEGARPRFAAWLEEQGCPQSIEA